MPDINLEELIKAAMSARQYAYAPYSGFKVGAALLAKNGEIYTGANIENASYGATVCAERTAVFKAVSEGVRLFSAIAIVGGKESKISDYAYPCGICRQVLYEFCDDDFLVITAKGTEDYKKFKLAELLPGKFKV